MAKWKLSRVPKGGGTLSTLDDFEAASLSFAIDDADAFVGSALLIHEASHGGAFRMSAFGRVSSAPKTGGTRRTLYEAIGRSARGLTLGGTQLFWLNGSMNGRGVVTVDAIMRTPKSGGPTTFAAMQQLGATSLAADGSSVYWTLEGHADARTSAWPPGAVMRMPIAGGPPQIVCATPPQPSHVAVDDGHVYWMHADGRVLRAAKAGGPRGDMQTVAEHASRYVVDDARIFWLTEDGVSSRSKDGAGEVDTRIVVSAPRTMAVDDSHVYVANASALWRVDKRTMPIAVAPAPAN